VRIPLTIEEAGSRLDSIDGLVTARQWERAAIVWAFTYEGVNRFSALKVTRYTIRQFAALRRHGLATQNSVRSYRSAWKRAMDEAGAADLKPGDYYEAPDLEWGWGETASRDRTYRHTSNSPEQFAQALNDGTVDPAEVYRHLDDNARDVLEEAAYEGYGDSEPTERTEQRLRSVDRHLNRAFDMPEVPVEHLQRAAREIANAIVARDLDGLEDRAAWKAALASIERHLELAKTDGAWSDADRRIAQELGLNL
jgi:hypothetical protein